MRLRMRENYNRIKSERALCLDFALSLMQIQRELRIMCRPKYHQIYHSGGQP